MRAAENGWEQRGTLPPFPAHIRSPKAELGFRQPCRALRDWQEAWIVRRYIDSSSVMGSDGTLERVPRLHSLKAPHARRSSYRLPGSASLRKNKRDKIGGDRSTGLTDAGKSRPSAVSGDGGVASTV